ncbi:DNA methylase [Xanthomonas phaseoli pv. phaseoli]|uniref:site-specific DNA-methyltransferase (adenine-specific) n=1 Tax=Xanthomonas axonopodis pv. cajani TaxID=487827 RepID=A0ABX3M7X4_9XANT|nr:MULTISPECIES: site-specific DNA-methyltransferase [Xanthomonas]AGI06869.1 Adenine specific DNA methylase [Xanthomonas citri subsp. citri Aw12879]AJZ43263.1 Adenine specific DNA methylase Mod [Xanthomonas citri pv. citri]AJZ47879.1 Adenine specific DNA methylase Mod [Xanthomonas citri pv. citri]AJZ52498.1 Adenine specific DNA methylase Mod [Xanthomonas citri pv. citri]AJZ65293.1 Adenine specific DNA methylase Mod [Xanthomonas citri pv. citri]
MPLLNWSNRDEDLTRSALTPYRLLEPVASLSYGEVDAPNMLIEGDNLDALKALLPYYAGQVKCIFIDPPYNTRSAFDHYDDNLEHAKWLSMMYPRLELLKELLSEDGSIWITLDDAEAHYLKVIMDEIFLRKNFVSTLIWEKADSPRNSARQFSSDHDFIFVYSKNEEWRPRKLPRDEKSNAIYTNPDNDPRGPWLPGDPYANKPYSKGTYTLTGPTGRTFSPPPGRFWRVSEEKLRDLDEDGRIWWGPKKDARPSIKKFLSEVGDLVPRTLWRKEDVGSNRTSKNELRKLFPGDVAFDTPKPEALLERVIRIATEEGDIVLDSFLGSGTTAAVAHKMGRRWIGVEAGEHARTMCQPRLAKVVDGEQGGVSEVVDWKGGGGFRFYKLGVPVFDDEGHIRAGIKFEHLAAHVWFAETGTARSTRAPKQPFLGEHHGIGYYLLFNGILGDESKAGGNVLTKRVLKGLQPFDGPTVIYGESCDLPKERLEELQITFKQTPYDIKAR